MATINPFIPSPALINRPRRRVFSSFLKQTAIAIGRSWRAYLRYKELNRLTDQALAARGLQRKDIARRVFVDDLT